MLPFEAEDALALVLLFALLMGEDDGAALAATVTDGADIEAAGKVFCSFVVRAVELVESNDIKVLTGCLVVTSYFTLTPAVCNLRRTFTTITVVIVTTLSVGSRDCKDAKKDVRKSVESLVTPVIV